MVTKLLTCRRASTSALLQDRDSRNTKHLQTLMEKLTAAQAGAVCRSLSHEITQIFGLDLVSSTFADNSLSRDRTTVPSRRAFRSVDPCAEPAIVPSSTPRILPRLPGQRGRASGVGGDQRDNDRRTRQSTWRARSAAGVGPMGAEGGHGRGEGGPWGRREPRGSCRHG